MVSPLTAKLSGYASSGSFSSDGSVGKKSPVLSIASGSEGNPGQVVNPDPMRCLLRSIDLSLSRGGGPSSPSYSLTPSLSGSNSSKHASAAAADVAANKRQKLNEIAYRASTARSDIARGGLVLQAVRTSRPVVAGIDMNKVQLVHSKKIQSPFLAQTFGSAAPAGSPLHSDRSQYEVADMIAACRAFYALPEEPPVVRQDVVAAVKRRADDESSTSSVTDEADASGEDDDGALQNVEMAGELPTSVISMSEALSITKMPRLITLAFAPFTIVHVNAAYTRMTGLSSLKVLGRPFHELLDDHESLMATIKSHESLPLMSLHEQTLKARSVSQRSGAMDCRAVIAPVGKDLDNVTHFSLELEQVVGTQYISDETSSSASGIGKRATSMAKSMTVMA